MMQGPFLATPVNINEMLLPKTAANIFPSNNGYAFVFRLFIIDQSQKTLHHSPFYRCVALSRSMNAVRSSLPLTAMIRS